MLTLLRIALIPVFVVLFYLPIPGNHFFSALFFAIAAWTDWLDGYLARYLEQTSALGAFLDPVADKLVVVVALVILISDPKLPYIALPAGIIISREIIISALREWMAELGKRNQVAVNMLVKVKTMLQMIAMVALILYRPEQDWWIGLIGYVLLYLSAALTLWSMYTYLKHSWPDIYSLD